MTATIWKQRRREKYTTHRHWLWRSRQRDCKYCGIRLTIEVGKPNTLTVDHIIPISRGGMNKRKNYVPACEPCNMEKGDLTADEFMRYRNRGS